MIYLIIFAAIIFESSLTTLPLTLIFLILYFIFTKKPSVFYIAFVSGIILDISLIRPAGLSSIYFICVLGLILLYSRKYEIRNIYFVGIFILLASMGYLFIFLRTHLVLASIVSVLISIIIYLVIVLFKSTKNRSLFAIGRV